MLWQSNLLITLLLSINAAHNKSLDVRAKQLLYKTVFL